ncbi:interference hedgehog-like isoform X2 [Thrips palmi]|uniref:Interference hedgehog n=1 Tax=Thrips palmi TaxID=161013 RepID=A0A6P8ZHE9_THRPL|nr:interference hedgehog-like isoform X2 [Thrips palmi]
MESPMSALASTVRFIIIFLFIQKTFADVGLRFVRAPEPIAAPPGDDVTFECSLNIPAEQVRWRHNGRYLNSTAHKGKPLQNSNQLNVLVNDERQTGDYQCVAWYGASALASIPAHLSLAEMGDFPNTDDTVIEVRKGNTILIHCQSPSSNPPAVLQYFKDGRNLPESVQVISSTGTLVLPNVSDKDEGTYTCSASNYITGNTITSHQKISLRVSWNTEPQQPRFPYRPEDNYTIATGSNVTLECAGSGYPTPSVSWRRKNGPLPSQSEEIPGGLRIPNVAASDRGTYVCELSNGIGRAVPHVISLFVQEPPTLVSEPPKTVGEEGGSCQLDCQFRGEPSPVITWLLNGESVNNDSLIKANGGTLRINRLEKRHAGFYQCMASNAQGTTYGSTMLQVKPMQVTAHMTGDNMPDVDDSEIGGPGNIGLTSSPSYGHHQLEKKEHRRGGKGRRKDKKHKGNAVMIPPTKPHITRLSDESVMVRWSVPDNVGLPIQFFKVQYRELGNGHTRGGGRRGRGNRWMTSNEDIAPHIRSYEVSNLEPDHTYRFRIAAVYSNNDNKLGPNSARFHLHRGSPALKTHLSTPLLTTTEAVSPSAIEIHWQYTPSASSPIEGFYVYYRATSNAGEYVKATVEGEQTRAYIITHLLPDTIYDIKLQSFTVGAASDFSVIRTHKTQREMTTPPPMVIQAGSSVITDTGSSSSMLYVVLGAVLGGLGLLLGLCLLVFLCNRHSQQSQEGSHNASHDPHEAHNNGDDIPVKPHEQQLFHGTADSGGWQRSAAQSAQLPQVNVSSLRGGERPRPRGPGTGAGAHGALGTHPRQGRRELRVTLKGSPLMASNELVP